MTEIHIRIEGRAGRITLDRPKALNALTYDMILQIEAALDGWAEADIDLLLIDAQGEKAFCAGGDIAEMYASGKRGDLQYGRTFWRDEYRMNRKLFHFPKPVVTFLQGFTMGGGVGVGCHGSHRIVCDTSRIAMPEVAIGLVPDVGGSLILAQAPGRLGEYLGTTGYRMTAADAIHAGFADYFIPLEKWDTLKSTLIKEGDVSAVDTVATSPGVSQLATWQADIDAAFAGDTLGDIYRGLPDPLPPALQKAVELMAANAPLSMAVAIEMVRRVRGAATIENALDQEYRFTFRAMEHGDFIEGIRAAIIDKDRNPKWRHANWSDVSGADVLRMTLPLGKDALNWKETP